MRRITMAMVLVAGLAALPPAYAAPEAVKRGNYYEAFTRQKYLDCLKDEVASGPLCVKKCQQDFRLDLTNNPPICIATKEGASYDPPKPTFTPPVRPIPNDTSKGY